MMVDTGQNFDETTGNVVQIFQGQLAIVQLTV